MKKLLLLFVLSLTCLFALTACEGLDLGGLIPGLGGGNTTTEPTDVPTEGEKEELSAELKSVRSYLIQMYGDGSAKATAADFYRISTVPVSGVALEVVWTASDESIVISAETEGDYAGMTKVAVGAIGATQRDYVLTATVTDSEGNVLELEFNCYVPAAEASTIADFIASKDQTSFKKLTGIITAVNKVGGKGAFVLTDATGSIFCYDGLDVALGDEIVVIGQLQLYNDKFPQLTGPALVEVVSQENDFVAASGEVFEVSAEQVKADVALGADTLIENYEGKYLAITGYAFKNANGYINLKASLTDTDACVNLYAAKEVGLTEALIDTKVVIYGFMRGTGATYLTVQVQSFEIVEEELTDEQLVQKALNAVSVTTEFSESAEVELPATSGDVQLAWELVGEAQPEFAIVEGKLVVTVANANASQTLKVTATLGEATLTKEFNLIVTYEIVYTSIAEALEIGAAKEHNTYTSEKYYLTGTVKSIYNEQFGNLYLTDGTNEITIYGVYIEGSKYGDYTGEKFAAGDTVVLYGPLGQYNGTAQMKNADLVSWEAGSSTPEVPTEPETPDTPETPESSNVVLTVDSLGIASQTYATGTKTVDGAEFEFVQIGNYGDGIQMRDKNGNTSTLWNTVAFGKGIVRIELVYSATKDVQYANANAVIFSFGDAADNLTYTTKLSTTAGVKTYTITPDAETYTFFKLEHDLGYTFYWESITIVLGEGAVTPDPDQPDTPEVPTEPETPVEPEAGNLTIVEAIELAKTKEHNTYTTNKYIITGTVKSIYNDQFGNLYLTDGTNEIVVYGVYIEGSKYGDYAGTKFVAGDTITVEGVLGTYNDVAQMKNADLVSWEAGSSTPEVPTEPETPVDPEVNSVVLTVDSLGIASQNYATSTKTVDGVDLQFIQIGNYGDGIQMRDKNGNTSTLWNTSAIDRKIARIELVYSATKDVQYANANAVIFSFGDAVDNLTYTTKLSTTAGVKTYTITPDAETYTFFKLEHDLGYTFYWESITIVFAE